MDRVVRGERKGDAAGDAAAAVQMAQRGGDGPAIVILSFVALVFSAISLYETVLKQAHFDLYLADTLLLGRAPEGSEVLALPLTIGNYGARDGAVTRLRLTVESETTGARGEFAAAYFGSNPAKDTQPFAPILVPGRSTFTGTILFYPKPGGNGRRTGGPVITGTGDLRFRLETLASSAADYGLFGGLLRLSPPGAEFTARPAWFSNPDLANGRTIPLHVIGSAAGGGPDQGQTDTQKN